MLVRFRVPLTTLVLALGVLLVVPARATVEVLTFEDLPSATWDHVPDGYAGTGTTGFHFAAVSGGVANYDWEYATSSWAFSTYGTNGLSNAAQGQKAAYVDFTSPPNGDGGTERYLKMNVGGLAFDLKSAVVGSFTSDHMPVLFTGLDAGGNPVASQPVDAMFDYGTPVTFIGFDNITEVRITSSSAGEQRGAGFSGHHPVFDNITVNVGGGSSGPVPELPPTILLALPGVFGMFVRCYGRRRFGRGD